MTRDIKDIITDMREIVKPCIAQMLFNENFEGKGNTDKAEFETEFEMLLTLAERSATVEPQEWISVKDRLPSKNDCYLVTFNFVSNGNPDNGIGVVEFYDGNFYSNGFGVNKDVVAWYIKPVPSPYKGDKE